jgi:hypothetical protein
VIDLAPLRTLTLLEPSRPGRPAHVSAASGLACVGERLYVIADDENHLAAFERGGTQPGRLVHIFPGTLPVAAEARKRNKPDVESVVRLPSFAGYPHGALLVLGSCSMPNRCSGVLLGLEADGSLAGTRALVDLAPLSLAFQERFGRLNIEGALAAGEELVLLQRANRGDRRNARIRLRLAKALESLARRAQLGIEGLVEVEEIDLGEVSGVPLGFTDGSALSDGRMAFTAVAEDTHDGYRDGACCGAAVGILGTDGRVERLEAIESRYKVEGIEATLEDGVVSALLVTDADDADVPAVLLACKLE